MKRAKGSFIVIASFTKGTGIAVFWGSELIHFEIRPARTNLKLKRATKQFLEVVIKLTARFEATTILISAPKRTQLAWRSSRRRYDSITRAIGTVGLPVRLVSRHPVRPEPARETPAGDPKGQLRLSAIYPELQRYESPSSRSQREYYRPLMVAVTTGIEWLRREQGIGGASAHS